MLVIDQVLWYTKMAISSIGVFVIILGAIRSVYQLMQFMVDKDYSINTIRLQFGHTVILGLEFMVAADIVGSIVEPDYYNLGLLGILVLIRTVLSYFLNLELETLSPQQRKGL